MQLHLNGTVLTFRFFKFCLYINSKTIFCTPQTLSKFLHTINKLVSNFIEYLLSILFSLNYQTLVICSKIGEWTKKCFLKIKIKIMLMLISFKIQSDFNLYDDYYYINTESFNEYYVNMWICWCSIALFHIYIYDLLWFVVRYIYDFYPTSCDIKSSGEGIQSVEYILRLNIVAIEKLITINNVINGNLNRISKIL